MCSYAPIWYEKMNEDELPSLIDEIREFTWYNNIYSLSHCSYNPKKDFQYRSIILYIRRRLIHMWLIFSHLREVIYICGILYIEGPTGSTYILWHCRLTDTSYCAFNSTLTNNLQIIYITPITPRIKDEVPLLTIMQSNSVKYIK